MRVERNSEDATSRWVHWSIEMLGRRYELRRRCDEAGAEDPWFGWVPFGDRLFASPTTWRYPTTISLGTEIEGNVEIELELGTGDAERSRVRRHYHAIARENVRVSGGSFDAWKLSVDETDTRDDSNHRSGYAWMTERVGLVRLDLGSASESVLLELTAWE